MRAISSATAAALRRGLYLLITSTPALAANTQQYTAGAAMACRPALPVFDGAIRTRPLAMANEGAATAFITCANWSIPYVHTNYNTVLTFQNRSGTAVDVSCTLVAGEANSPTYTTRTITVAANAGNNAIWGTLSNPGLPGTLRYSCALPPAVELGEVLWGSVV